METALITAAKVPLRPIRGRILNVAEAEFSQNEFGGAGMKGRAIATGKSLHTLKAVLLRGGRIFRFCAENQSRLGRNCPRRRVR